jgi:L-ascorbate metabolism protein UlaG (beta-lactamase superfamily)
MEIYWLGQGCFRLRGRDAAVLTDPCPPSTGYRIGKVNADVVTISSDRAESNYRQAAGAGAKFIDKPGEYEIAGVLLTGIRTGTRAKNGEGNVAYVIDIDDIRVCHLGDASQVPTADDVETLGVADILLVPVGGGSMLNAEKAAETVSLLEPKIVIPMLYRTDASKGELDPVDKFLREMGTEAKPPEQRLNITKSGLPHDTTVVVLSHRGA